MNFGQIIQVAQAVGSLLPVVATLVKGVEEAMPAGTPGAIKLDAVRSALQSIYSAEQSMLVQFETVWAPLQGMITSLVNAYHSAGTFARKGVAAVTATPTP